MRAWVLVGPVVAAALASSCHGTAGRSAVVDLAPPAAIAPSPEPPRGAVAPRDVGRTRSVTLEPDGDWDEAACGPTTAVRYRIGGPGGAAAATDPPPATTGTTSDCRATFDALHRASAVSVGVQPFVVRVSDVAVTRGDVTLFAARDACEELAAMDGCPTDETLIGWSLMSLVGPVITIRELHSSAGGGGPYYHHEAWWTIDLRTGEPAALDALVIPRSLLDGVRRSPDLRGELEGEALARLDAASTLDEAFAAAGIVGDRPQGTLGYAFPRPHAGGHTAMRIGHRGDTFGMSPNRLETVDVEIDPRPEARAWFVAARRGLGVLAGDEVR